MDSLRQLGLTKYEGTVYLTLVKNKALTAKEIARNCDVPPTAVYPNLKSLIEKGFIHALEGDVKLFKAIKPELALKTYVKKKNEQLHNLTQELIPQLNSLQSSDGREEVPQLVTMSQGLESSHTITDAFMQNAKKTIYILGWKFRTKETVYPILHKLLHVVKRGVDVRLIVAAKTKNYDIVKKMHEKGIPMRYYPINNFSIIIRDEEECKITLKSQQMKERVNLHITDKDLTHFQQEYFLSIWKKAKKIV